MDVLIPYVPGLVIEWLETTPEQTCRTIDGTGVFADISGFTNLTERLARKGKVGAEEMGDTLNLIFDHLLRAAYHYGAGLVKWGGDAVLLLFQGELHAPRAAKAAAEMQRVIARVGRVNTSSGNVRLRMSIGLHSGELDFMLVGSSFRELIVTGPGASLVARMETFAEAGEVVVSEASAGPLEEAGAVLGEHREGGRLMLAPPPIEPLPEPLRGTVAADLRQALPGPVVQHLLGGVVEYEHRNVAVCFIEFSGVDELRQSEGLEAATRAVAQVVEAAQAAADLNEVMFLSSDIYPDGGKVILISGAPTSAGDDAARILTAARQVLDSPHTLSVRAGVNIGRVFAGDYGPARRRVYSVTGDCVNLAARLMAKAGHEELVASAAALERSRTKFETVELEPFPVKGKAELIEASVVGRMRPKERSQPIGGLRLAGRDEELAALLDAMDTAVTGSGRAVELVGEPGIGKSRLLQELKARSNMDVLWMDGDIYGTSTPYEPFHRLFAEQLGLTRGDIEGSTRLLRQLVKGYAPHCEALLPLLGIVAGIDLPNTPEVEALDPTVRKEVLESVTSEVLGAVFAEPTLLIFNDVHFMDEATTDLLNRLVADATDRRWLIVPTRRPNSEWQLGQADHVTSIDLQPLAAGAADDLLTAAIGDRAIPPHRMEALVARAGGNPLFLTELAAGIDGVLADGSIPDSIEAIIASRIDRLAPPYRTLLRSAAVLGMTLEPALFKSVLTSLDGVRITAPHMAELGEFLTPLEDGTYRFSHHLVRETAYEGLPFRRRVQLHAATADVVADRLDGRPDRDNLLSLHSFHGARYADAFTYAKRAGAMAREQFANTEAAECYERAIRSARHLAADARGDVGAVWETLAEIHEDLGDLDAMGESLRQARLQARGDPTSGARTALHTAAHRRLNGQYSESLRWVTRGRAALEGRQDPEARSLMAQLAHRYSQTMFEQGRFRRAIHWADIALKEASPRRDRQIRARALEIRNLATSFSGKVVDLRLAIESLDLYASIGDMSGLARGQNVTGLLCLTQGEWVDALGYYRASAETYRRLGRQLDIALQEANAAEILIHQGQLDVAEAMLADSMKVWRGTHALGERAFGHSLQGRIAMARGDFAAATELFERAVALHREVGETYEALTVETLLAECALVAGDPAGALARVRSVVDLQGEPGPYLLTLTRLEGQALVALGEHESGVHQLRSGLADAKRVQASYDEALALVALIGCEAATDAEQEELERLRGVVLEHYGVQLPIPPPTVSGVTVLTAP